MGILKQNSSLDNFIPEAQWLQATKNKRYYKEADAYWRIKKYNNFD